MGGELDLEPHALTMGMSRERIQRDSRWTELGNRLQDRFISAALDELHNGTLRRRDAVDSPSTKRNLLLWYHFLPSESPFSELYDSIDTRIFRLSSNGCGWVEARSAGRRGVLAARAASELTAHGVHLIGDGRSAPWRG